MLSSLVKLGPRNELGVDSGPLAADPNVNRATMCFVLCALCFVLYTLRAVDDAALELGVVVRPGLGMCVGAGSHCVTLSVTLEKVFCLLN